MRVVSNLLITLGGDSELITRSVITRVTVADSLRGGGGGGGGGVRTWGHRLLFEKRARALAGLGRISGSER